MLRALFRRPLSLPRRWAIAAGAQLARMHREPLDRLGVNGFSRWMQRRALVPNWGIISAESACNTLDWLATEGHNAPFVAGAPAELRRLAPGGHILAWDIDRLVCVSRWCCKAGYVTHGQAWEWIMSGARRAQPAYRSWAEYAAGYAAGFRFWAGGPHEMDDEIRNTGLWLLQSDQSPWRRLPWGLPLDE